ncbi:MULTISPECIES: DUF2190 family protein [Nocardiaceae]|uniref:DUF2190 family protein n=1 Tax=Nocardiaceae TaxID=85025 RepID=UPI0005626678|nr:MULTISPECIES: DUF2190 family protein [Rhodococcus]OZF44274.1 DUF2190 domain-containing protein [Rhodococcus sp. 14-2470-1a]
MGNLTVDKYAPGSDLSAVASAPVVAGRFAKITGNRTGNGMIPVAHADAGGRTAGVVKYDAATGGAVSLARGNSRVVKVKASGAIAAFTEIQVGADGQAVALSSGKAVGYALSAAASGSAVEVSLY